MSEYGVISGPNTGKYRPEITSYLNTFHAVMKMRIYLAGMFSDVIDICRSQTVLQVGDKEIYVSRFKFTYIFSYFRGHVT